MPLRRRVRQILVELVSAFAGRLASLARRVGLSPRSFVTDGTSAAVDGVCFLEQRPGGDIPPAEPLYVDEPAPTTDTYRTMHAQWGASSVPPAGIITAHDVQVSMPTGVHRWRNRIFREGLLGVEALQNPKYLAAFVAMMFVGGVELSEGVLLGLPWNHNFYHWLVEMLPRLQLVDEVTALQEAPLLVPASAPAFVPETLRVAGYGDRVLRLDDGVHRVETLHIPTRLAPTADVSPDAVRWLDERFPTSQPSGRRIYVSRADAPVRYVSNDAEIGSMLEQEHGFETLSMSALPFEEQVRAFREASVIVGAHGAAFAHLAFAPRGAAFLELFQNGHFNHCYGRMAAIRGLRYGFIVGERDGLGLRVDRASLGSVVERIVRDLDPPRGGCGIAALQLS